LLGLGLATLSPTVIAIPVVWFACLYLRMEHPRQGRWAFNASQVGLALLTLVTFMVLYSAVHHGLILHPNMNVQGNSSSNFMLQWYLNRAGTALPQPSVVSLPLWAWRLFMLAWSSWLVFALLGWLRWGWSCFEKDGLWKAKAASEKPNSAQES